MLRFVDGQSIVIKGAAAAAVPANKTKLSDCDG